MPPRDCFLMAGGVIDKGFQVMVQHAAAQARSIEHACRCDKCTHYSSDRTTICYIKALDRIVERL